MTSTVAHEAALAGRPELLPFAPPIPEQLEDTGLASSLVEQLILKTVYHRGETIGRDLAHSLGLPFSAIAPLIEIFRRRRMLYAKGSLGIGDISTVFALSDEGRTRARACIEENHYSGPAPVPLAAYAEAVRKQRYPDSWLTRERLEAAYSHMVLPEEVLNRLGPALNSGKSLLLYGQPGNGKTHLAHAVASIEAPPVFVPYAVEAAGNIIQVYDPAYHARIGGADDWQPEGYDGRWARCKRPFIAAGSELTLERLETAYNKEAKVYDAPLQMRANNGVLLIDDFGRQKITGAELLNRWISPMERGVDVLSFQTGMKLEIPFEVFLIFSTNLPPSRIADEAFLRRIEYKLLLKDPGKDEFAAIFRRVCASKGLACPEPLLGRFIDKHYGKVAKPFRRCHPRSIVSHALDTIHFARLPRELNEELLDQAFRSCFLETGDELV